EPGADRRLADYDQIVAYFRELAATSDRVVLDGGEPDGAAGRTTEGRPFFVAVISAPDNLRRLEEIRRDHLRLAEPRGLAPDEGEALVSRGKAVVACMASIHSNEVGPTQAMPALAHRLATTDDPELLRALESVVLVVVPCHNPDGYVAQVDWYRRWVGTPYEAAPLPDLYHRYVGHDNNRDWYAFTQVESRLTVDAVYARWRPVATLDQHQMTEDGPRLFVPPYQAPVEPHVDGALLERLDALGGAIRRDFAALGLKGVVSGVLFDAWSPNRAYVHYHGGVRVLTEIASARQATPVEAPRVQRRWTAASPENPDPWPPGPWRLSDVVRYDVEVALSALKAIARERATWLGVFRDVLARGAAPKGFAGYALVGADALPGGRPRATDMATVLRYGGVEARRVRGAQAGLIDADPARTVPDGAWFVPAGQPFFPFAQALLENVPYPEIRDGGALRRPYDVVCHHLPTLLGFEALRLDRAPETRDDETPAAAPTGPGAAPPACAPRAVRRAVYRSAAASMDEGWLRFFCDVRGISIERFGDDDVATRLVRRDAAGRAALIEGGPRLLVIPDLGRDVLNRGPSAVNLPPERRGGLGDAGAAAARDFVRAGGTLVCIKDSCAWAIDLLGLPLRNVLLDLPEGTRVDVPGAALRLIDAPATSPLAVRASGWPRLGAEGAAAIFQNGKAWTLSAAPEGARSAPAPQYLYAWAPSDRIRLSGYAEGVEHLAGRAAVVRADVGAGRAILFGFAPHFRHVTHATFPLLDAALDDV
ncbi:MAG TPA: M14 family zinc carboxypeptidase, partial [Planctomycetota bacterium]|nr:M14 family zinc carboxypeptidase [Planctomycetota bacterium]